MIDIQVLILVMFVHFVSDFVLQTRWMATNKSTSNVALFTHIIVYMIPLSLIFGFTFAVINGMLHYVVDYFTSRGTSYYWKKQETHKFFIIIGFDQFLHFVCLLLTYKFIDYQVIEFFK